MDRPLALVTGATRGIGLAIARDLGRDHHVLVGGRDRAACEAVCAELGSAEPFDVELTDIEALTAAAARVPRLDLLVANAGVTSLGTLADAGHDEWLRVLRLNVVAVADTVRLLLPRLRESGGMVVTINSGSGFRSGPGAGVYSASKFALRAYTDALREEERGRVRVVSIHPGRVDTDLQREQFDHAGAPYVGAEHLAPASVAAAVRLAVDLPPEANVDELSLRPAVQTNP